MAWWLVGWGLYKKAKRKGSGLVGKSKRGRWTLSYAVYTHTLTDGRRKWWQPGKGLVVRTENNSIPTSFTIYDDLITLHNRPDSH